MYVSPSPVWIAVSPGVFEACIQTFTVVCVVSLLMMHAAEQSGIGPKLLAAEEQGVSAASPITHKIKYAHVYMRTRSISIFAALSMITHFRT